MELAEDNHMEADDKSDLVISESVYKSHKSGARNFKAASQAEEGHLYGAQQSRQEVRTNATHGTWWKDLLVDPRHFSPCSANTFGLV
jgi:hypothetical protein